MARQHYPAESDITSFFGLFFGFAGLATLLTTTLLLSRILRWLGMGNIYLWVCAAYLLAAALLTTVFGDRLPAPEIVVIFALNLLSYVLLDSIIAPTYQVLIKLVPQRNSDGTRMIMEGGFMLVGGLLGAAVTALHAQQYLTMPQFFIVLAALSAAMVVAGWRLKTTYTQVLIQAVREQQFAVDDEQAEQAMREVVTQNPEFPRSLLLHRDDGVRSMGIEILRQNPIAATAVCEPLIGHENPRIRSAAVDALSVGADAVEILEKALPLLDDAETEVRLSAARFVARTIESSTGPDDLNEVLRQRIIESVSPRLVPDADNPALQSEFLYILDKLNDAGTAAVRVLVMQGLLDSDSVDDIAAGIRATSRLCEAACYPQLVEHLHHSHPAVREAAIHGVAGLGHADVLQEFLKALGDPDPDVVEAAVEALAADSNPENRQTMAAALGDRPTRQWEGLIGALSAREDDSLSEQLSQSSHERLLQANRYLVAMGVLEASLPGQSVDLLIDQLRLQLSMVQNGAIRLLGQLGDVDVVNELVERLGQDDPAARENAVELLENIGDPSMMKLLIPLLIDDREEQQEAARQASGMNATTVDEALALPLKSRDTWTQLAAVWAAAAADKTHLFDHLPADIEPAVRETIEEITKARGVNMSDRDQPLTSMEKITFLKASPFFAALPLEELYHIALTVQEETVKEGGTVIKQGTLGDKMYIVVRGRLAVKRFDEGDNEGQQVAVIDEKQVFGDMALLDDEPRSASVIAMDECNLLSLQRGDLERILRRYSSIAFNMMRILSSRLRDSMAA